MAYQWEECDGTPATFIHRYNNAADVFLFNVGHDIMDSGRTITDVCRVGPLSATIPIPHPFREVQGVAIPEETF
jgi:hypothetical protein